MPVTVSADGWITGVAVAGYTSDGTAESVIGWGACQQEGDMLACRYSFRTSAPSATWSATTCPGCSTLHPSNIFPTVSLHPASRTARATPSRRSPSQSRSSSASSWPHTESLGLTPRAVGSRPTSPPACRQPPRRPDRLSVRIRAGPRRCRSLDHPDGDLAGNLACCVVPAAWSPTTRRWAISPARSMTHRWSSTPASRGDSACHRPIPIAAEIEHRAGLCRACPPHRTDSDRCSRAAAPS